LCWLELKKSKLPSFEEEKQLASEIDGLAVLIHQNLVFEF
jgi:hypothetical protein